MSAAPLYPFVLIDHTTAATPANLAPASDFNLFIEAWLEQINGPFAAAWGGVSVAFRVGSGPDDRQPNEIAINFRDTIPEAPGALAYHTITSGIPDIELGVDLFSSLTGQNESLSAGGSHELLELLGDPGANRWADAGTGIMNALEAADMVQNTGYPACNGVWVSNFVLLSFFNPQASGPWDQMGVMKAADDVSNGYGIQTGSPTDYTQIGGMRLHQGRTLWHAGTPLTLLQKKQKAHPYSRAYRRGLRISAA
jgi:hypothetical protein